jgi:hypothetical protein
LRRQASSVVQGWRRQEGSVEEQTQERQRQSEVLEVAMGVWGQKLVVSRHFRVLVLLLEPQQRSLHDW